MSHISLSPNGRLFAGVEARDGVEAIVVHPLDVGANRRLARIERSKDEPSKTIQTVGWASDEDILVGVGTLDPWSQTLARRSRLFALPLDGPTRYLGKNWPDRTFIRKQDSIASWLPGDPDHILLNLWFWDEIGASAHLVDVHSGQLQTVIEPHENAVQWMADHRGVVRAGVTLPENGREWTLLARTTEHDEFAAVRTTTAGEDRFEFAGFSPKPEILYVYRNNEAGRLAVYTFSIRTQKVESLVFEHPEYDVASIRLSKVDGRILGVGFQGETSRMQYFDDAFGRHQRRLNALLPERLNGMTSLDQIERHAIVQSASDVHPPKYYRFDIETGELVLLLSAYPELEEAKLAPMRPIQFEARDGLTITGYLTLPPDAEERHAPVPAIVLPHGGPSARDVWGWNAEVQFLASRGFAVLQPNFRGSFGYGAEFMDRSIKAWDGAMLEDIADAARWLVDQGIADADRIGIYGSSYGGYAALRALDQEPSLFRAGASLAGVTNLMWLADHRRHIHGQQEPFARMVGDPQADSAALERSSPVNNVDGIQAPVLIAHGTRDPTVNIRQAHAMLDALADAGKPEEEVEYYLYEGELHGFIDERNAIHFYTRLADFFERHLAPRDAGH